MRGEPADPQRGAHGYKYPGAYQVETIPLVQTMETLIMGVGSRSDGL
jgi:hypothetical protein